MMNETVLVVGGGVAGMRAALSLAACGIKTVLAEKAPQLGGHTAGFGSLFPSRIGGGDLVRSLVSQIQCEADITVLNAAVVALARRSGALEATLRFAASEAQQRFKAVLLAGGYDVFPVERYGEYGYGRYHGVVTSLDFEHNQEEIIAKSPRVIAFLQCIGARDHSKGAPYCSKICCMYTAKQAVEIREALPDSQVYVFYMDVRASFCRGEEFVRAAMETARVRYIRGRAAKIFPRQDRLILRAEDTLMGVPLEMEADLIVLAAAMTPDARIAALARQAGAVPDDYGFLMPPLRADAGAPLGIADGVFCAGACAFPADVVESMAQGAAAAAGAAAFLRQSRKGGGAP